MSFNKVFNSLLCVRGVVLQIILDVYNLFYPAIRLLFRRAFSESFPPFRAEPHQFYIYRQYTNIVFILQ
jgi:hypothetical protein